jgi:glycosyltransferase involved in cell wall biosynthesis
VQIEDIPLSFAFPLEQKRNADIDSRVAGIEREHTLDTREILLYTGNLKPYQGIDLLLDAWKHFIDTTPEWKSYCLVIAGGPESLVESCKKRIIGTFWQESVVFLGPRPSEEMERWMSSASCLISPRSQGENTPLKIYSYMAAGKPIIATRMQTHTQVLDDETAFLVEPYIPDMAAAITEVFNDHEGALLKAKAAQEKVHRCYSFDIFSEKLLRAYALATGKTIE